jgi:1,2-diacylglycerol 3-alpha-glucosyltransferase
MRIAMYTDAFYPVVSGVATAVLILANALAEAGHQVFVQAPSPKHEADLSFLHPNVTVKYVRAIDIVIYPDFRLGTSLPLSLSDIRDFNPDLIHVHTPLSVGLEGILVSKRLKIPLIQTFHTYFMDEETFKLIGIRNAQLGRIISRGGWRLNRVLSRLCDATIAPTEFVAADLREHGTPEPIVVCPNLLSENAYAKQTRRNQQVRSFLYVGRLSPEKRVDLLLRSFALARQKLPDTELIIVGDGPERQALFDLSLKLKISSHVRWFGKIPHHDLIEQRLYHLGDVFVTLSRFETFGYTTLEAMAHQLPVIALASRANTEVIGKAGFLIPDTANREAAVTAAAKKMVAVGQKDLEPLRQKAYEQAQKYSPRHLLPAYEKVYRDVLASFSPANGADAEL